MRKLVYYVESNNEYHPIYEYPQLQFDELYARQLCTYLILQGQQYERYSNEIEIELDQDSVVLKEMGRNYPAENERNYRGQGIHLEFRFASETLNYPLLASISLNTHYEVLYFLLKDVVVVDGQGQMLVTSTELDEDRGVYVIYVMNLE